MICNTADIISNCNQHITILAKRGAPRILDDVVRDGCISIVSDDLNDMICETVGIIAVILYDASQIILPGNSVYGGNHRALGEISLQLILIAR